MGERLISFCFALCASPTTLHPWVPFLHNEHELCATKNDSICFMHLLLHVAQAVAHLFIVLSFSFIHDSLASHVSTKVEQKHEHRSEDPNLLANCKQVLQQKSEHVHLVAAAHHVIYLHAVRSVCHASLVRHPPLIQTGASTARCCLDQNNAGSWWKVEGGWQTFN